MCGKALPFRFLLRNFGALPRLSGEALALKSKVRKERAFPHISWQSHRTFSVKSVLIGELDDLKKEEED